MDFNVNHGTQVSKRSAESKWFLAGAVIFVSCGCAHLAIVKITEPRVPTIGASEAKLTLANQRLAAAERAQPLVALGDDLSAAKLSLQILEQRPTDSPAQSIYNFSVARAVENVR